MNWFRLDNAASINPALDDKTHLTPDAALSSFYPAGKKSIG
jgi:hypothetical protein